MKTNKLKKLIPVDLLPPLCAKDDTDAGRMLGVCPRTIYRLCGLPAGNPRRIRKTTYGKIPVAELVRHLEAEMEAAGKFV